MDTLHRYPLNGLRLRVVPSALRSVFAVLLISSVLGTLAPAFAQSTGRSANSGKRHVTVMTRNLYIGAPLEPIVGGNPSEIPVLVAQTLEQIFATDFPARAAALAAEISLHQPDVVGLQEVTLLRVQSPGDFLAGNPQSATEPILDYLQILQMQLAARGAAYSVAVIVTNWDVELPMVVPTGTGFQLDDLRATDFDVILLRADLPPGHLRLLGTDADNYLTRFEISIGGLPVAFPRGWCLVDLLVRGRAVRVINTHLENVAPILRAAQAVELVSGPAAVSGDIICLGDFNSDAAFPPPEAFPVMLAAGFANAWDVAHPGDPGYTWGQAPNLLNPVSTVTERDDHVWFRGRRLSVGSVTLVGGEPTDRVPSLVNPQNLLWPSDHLGVVSTFLLR